jgi:hypothetical protein
VTPLTELLRQAQEQGVQLIAETSESKIQLFI